MIEKSFLETIKEICNKDVSAIFSSEIDFLKSRKSYLTSDQVEKIGHLIDDFKDIAGDVEHIVEEVKELVSPSPEQKPDTVVVQANEQPNQDSDSEAPVAEESDQSPTPPVGTDDEGKTESPNA